jgi:hypothetical protein
LRIGCVTSRTTAKTLKTSGFCRITRRHSVASLADMVCQTPYLTKSKPRSFAVRAAILKPVQVGARSSVQEQFNAIKSRLRKSQAQSMAHTEAGQRLNLECGELLRRLRQLLAQVSRVSASRSIMLGGDHQRRRRLQRQRERREATIGSW